MLVTAPRTFASSAWVLLTVLPTSVWAADAGDVPACPSGADYQPVETRCDGIDNDCDGLVDVLLPVTENECSAQSEPHAGWACQAGHAACMDGQRVCLAPGPAPESFDGEDNDCNGVVDDAPGWTGPLRAKALLLVPGYLFADGPLELDHIASVLDQWGIAYDRPASPSDFDAALPTLAQYPLVVIPGYLEEDFLVPFRQSALEDYATQGGVLVVFKPILDSGSQTQNLLGTAGTVRRFDVDAIAFEPGRPGATRAFDSVEELRVPINAQGAESTVVVHILTPAFPEIASLATAFSGSAAVGSALTRRSVGKGIVYAVGYDLHSSFGNRCYTNCFEPAGDLAGLFLREAFREGLRGHVVLKHTVPGPEDSVALLSHDLDALDGQQPGDAWGSPGALQVASLERQLGARGSFFVTTGYVATPASVPYYSPGLMQSLCALDMCPVGAHSVAHSADFHELPLGSCDEAVASYDPASSPTLCGEIRVPLEILTQTIGPRPIAWRSPYLRVNPSQYDVLASEGMLVDSSYAVGDLKSNLPISLARTGERSWLFHHRPLYTMPIALEDGIGEVTDGVVTREEMSAGNAATFATLWTYATLRNADNGAHTLSLLHPSYGVGQPPSNVLNKLTVLARYLAACQARRIRTADTVADIVSFWRARDEMKVDAVYSQGHYSGTITTGVHTAANLTLEFGDTITSFVCASCGVAQASGKRITLSETLAPGQRFEFQATVGVVPTELVPATKWYGRAALGIILLLLGGRLTKRRSAVGAQALLLVLLGAPAAAAQQSPYCTQVRERAADDAALLLSPRLLLQGLRFPDHGQLIGGTVTGEGFQARAALSYSVKDLLKGKRTILAGEADCREHEARIELEGRLGVGDDDARKTALAAQITFLEAHVVEVHGWVDKARARLAERVITLIELQDIRARANALDRKLAQAKGQVAQLEARRPSAVQKRTADLAGEYTGAATELARSTAHVRALDPWQLDISAGIIPSSRSEWYGIVQLGYNLGGLRRSAHAESQLLARQEELVLAPYELVARARQARELLIATRNQALAEAALIDRDLEALAGARNSIEGQDAPNIVHVRERLAIEQLAIEADRIYTQAYADSLTTLIDGG